MDVEREIGRSREKERERRGEEMVCEGMIHKERDKKIRIKNGRQM